MQKLLRLLGTKYPIIQAPMAGADNAQFVAAACEAGVLGSLGAQYRNPDEIRSAIREIRSLTDKPFAVNLFALPLRPAPSATDIESVIHNLRPYYSRFRVPEPSVEDVQRQINADDQLSVLLEEDVPVFSFTLGLLSQKWIDAFKSKGTIIIGTATNTVEARLLQQSGVDAVCAQGMEAGGHRGTFDGDYVNSMIGLMALLPQITHVVDVPVIAAGGIMNGSGIAAALALGAAGVQLGTAFLTTAECPVHPKYKQAISTREAHQTAITRAFSGGAARGITNKFMQEQYESELLPFPFHNAVTRPIRKAANEAGDIDYTNLWSGQGGKLARHVTTQELVNALVSETNDALAALGQVRL